jgi:morphogenetic protein associated with SpoVID
VKIHIVQKGDTLWKLAEKYGVDFDVLVKSNNHLSNPEMLMPGMKIKIPTGAVPAKKDDKKKKPLPTFEDLKGSMKKGNPKKEMPKVDYTDKEGLKAESIKKEMKEMPKIDFPKKEHSKTEMLVEELKGKTTNLKGKTESLLDKTGQLKQLLKETTPSVLKSLLQEVKPEFLESWSMDFELLKEKEKGKKKPMPSHTPTKLLPIEEVGPMKTAPPPSPEWVMPSTDKVMPHPFKADAHPCPPYPTQHHGSYYPMLPQMQQAQPTPYLQPMHSNAQPNKPQQTHSLSHQTQPYSQPHANPTQHYTHPAQQYSHTLPPYMQPAQHIQPIPSNYPMHGMPAYTSPYMMPGTYGHDQMSYHQPGPSNCGCAPTKATPTQLRSGNNIED